MAIAKNPIRNTSARGEEQAAAFISKAVGLSAESAENAENRKQTVVRIPPELLARAGRGAQRLGLSRSAFICLSVAEKLERMES